MGGSGEGDDRQCHSPGHRTGAGCFEGKRLSARPQPLDAEGKQQPRAAVASRPGVLETTKMLEDLRNLDARAEVTTLYRKATDLLRDAEGAQDLLATKGFLAEARQLLELMGRWAGAFLDLRSRMHLTR